MPSFFTDAQKTALQDVMTDVHDTFKRTLKVFKEGKDVILSTNVNYSHIYKQPLGNVQKQTVERDIQARIYYFPRKIGNESVGVTSEDSLKVQQPTEEVRLKMAIDDYEFVKDAERFILDGAVYAKASAIIPNGLFGSGFYTIYLRRTS